jgi:hypothetical protein
LVQAKQWPLMGSTGAEKIDDYQFTKPILRNRQRWNLYWQPKYRTLHFGITEETNCGGIAGCISLHRGFQ